MKRKKYMYLRTVDTFIIAKVLASNYKVIKTQTYALVLSRLELEGGKIKTNVR